MGNAIEKTFSILERIVSAAPEPLPPSVLAAELNLNRATCSRLLKQLMDLGYILRFSRQQGYVPGPKLATLNSIAGFQRDLIQTAKPVIDRCASELRASVLIAQLYGGKRYVLYHRNDCPSLDIRISRPCYDDIFCTATGLLLIAHCGREEQIARLREQKSAGREIMSDFSSEKNLSRKLQAIVEQGMFECEKGVQWIYAFPIYRDGKFCAALGSSIPREQHTPAVHRMMCRVLKQTAQEISRGLTPRYTIG